jgi:hypothetical protein
LRDARGKGKAARLMPCMKAAVNDAVPCTPGLVPRLRILPP